MQARFDSQRWNLSQNVPDFDWTAIKDAFHKKMKFKNIEFIGLDQIINPENDKQLMAAWNNSFGHQVPGDNFPGYKEVRDETSMSRILLTQQNDCMRVPYGLPERSNHLAFDPTGS